jgi:UDP-glucose 4-epimerase
MRALVTGGAGFIGSHLANGLLERGAEVRVLDNLFTGRRESVPAGAEVIDGDVADHDVVARAVEGVDVVFHQAAHRAVPRSIETPLATNRANTHGTLCVLSAAQHAGVRRVVCASSSSVYGPTDTFPTPESAPLTPMSPYAVSKLAGEHYCRVFAELHGLQTVSLRYFNVYGPRQPPDVPYAQVVPLFIGAMAAGASATVHGDGEQRRDFTYIDDVVAANIAAAEADGDAVAGEAYNVGGGRDISVVELLKLVAQLLGAEPRAEHVAPRAGDVRRTWSDVSAAARDLGWRPRVDLEEGLRRTIQWYGGADLALAAT